jgi:hypothetical protein
MLRRGHSALIQENIMQYEATEWERNRIGEQATKAQRLECMHQILLKKYISNSYMAFVLTMVFGAIAATALFLMGATGWKQANPYLVCVFLPSAAVSAFFGAFPAIFRYQEVIAVHTAQLVRYEALLDGMASHIASPQIVPAVCIRQMPDSRVSGNERSFAARDFITCTDTALAALNIPYSLDPRGAPDYARAFGARPN